ncbi:MAG: UDP-2,3-diacylglucosamine diphosphatase [Gammaproteobacteria bacterium]|nr:UDP-2,3-diacylglucosamine diphosphatase [Gammaproteobacteria bacterium]
MSKLTVRSIFVSDIHLGTRGAQAEYLLDLLDNTESEYLYLVGDVFDLWKLHTGWFWPQLNNRVVQALFSKARRGTRVIYIPGNHDALMRDYAGMEFNGVRILRQAEHVTADGRRLLVTHGDELDGVVAVNRWLSHIGDLNYYFLLTLNRYCDRIRRLFGHPYWSLSAYIKGRVGKAVEYVRRFEVAAAERARHAGLDGVVCGHIHVGKVRDIDGLLYANSGDWVENCTALIEETTGEIRLLHWARDSFFLISAEEETVEIALGERVIG